MVILEWRNSRTFMKKSYLFSSGGKYPIMGVKAADFQDWCKVAELMKTKKHLTPEGLDQIRKIKAGMNMGRVSIPRPSAVVRSATRL